jgi:hypothetical protein
MSYWNCRQTIERDVLRVINAHPKLRRYGRDFESVGVHKVRRPMKT